MSFISPLINNRQSKTPLSFQTIQLADLCMENMPSIVAFVDSVSGGVRGVRRLLQSFCDKRRVTEIETVENQLETDSDDLQPNRKRRKVQQSLCINSEYVNRISDCLGKDNIKTIGIYGMGGVGKTTLAKHLYEQLRNNNSTNNHAIVWVTMEMDLTTYQLQKRISEAFGLDLKGDKDENRRAAMLYAYLSCTDRKRILFIDELWADFRREDIGIPRSCKMIVISRLQDVCRMLHCQETIRVEPLSEEESWQLFHHSIGEYGFSDPEQVSSDKKLVFDESAGLPLAIAALAKSVTGVINASTWRKFSIEPTQMEDLLNKLKLSYDRLKNIKLQRCFLHCASYLKGGAIRKEDLINLWVGEKLIDDVPSVEAQHDMGHSILNKLINSCLLETSQDKRSIKMHDLVRRMAHFISRDCSLVNADEPSKSDFCRDLNGVSLIKSSVSLIQ